MENVDIITSKFKVENIGGKITVLNGEKFRIETSSEVPLQWFSNNDPVLDIIEDDASADFTATAIGNSKVQIQDSSNVVLKTLNITVTDATADLGLSGDVVPKT